MSFSTEVKEELAALRTEKSCCMLSELNALTQSCASMTLLGRGQVSIVFKTENVTVAKRIFILLKRRLEINATPHFTKMSRFGGRRVCQLRLSPADSRKLMYALHMIHEGAEGEVFRGIPRRAMTRNCCRQAFVRGAFLGAGSVALPEREHHLEFVCNSEKRASAVSQLLTRNDIECSTVQRRGAFVVYMKRGAQISSLLGWMGAVRAMMRYENVLIQRSLHKNVLRATNCDNNNMMRHLSAAQEQIRAIETLRSSGRFDALPPAFKEIAELRCLHPEATLEQIGDMLEPKLGKSGVNHRFRKIMALAREPER